PGPPQAERRAVRGRDHGISAIYSSPLSRAVETARIVATGCGLEPRVSDGVREGHHGHWEGLTRQEVEARFAAQYAAWEEDPFTFAPEGGESGVSVLARALPAL